MTDDMVMRRMLADEGQSVHRTRRGPSLPDSSGGRAGLGAVLILVLTAGAALGGTADLMLALGAPLGMA